MKLLLTRFMLILACFAVSACSAKLNTRQYSGMLYFADGQTIFALDMKSREFHPIYYNQMLGITSLYEIDQDHLLMSAMQIATGYTPSYHIYVFNLNTRSVTPVAENAYYVSDATYMRKYDAIIFFGEQKNGTNMWGMYWIHRSEQNKWHLIDSNGGGQHPMPVVVSDDTVVYRDRDGRLKMFNFANNRVSVLNISNCYPVLWRAATQQLLCGEPEGKGAHYFLISLDDMAREELPFNVFDYGPIVYIRKYDLLLLTSRTGKFSWAYMRPYEGSDMWTYEFKSGQLEKFLPGGDATSVAVWYP
ncbi:MAG: hypothetical protein ACREAN_08680 [Nitrosopumilaceae archaeon]